VHWKLPCIRRRLGLGRHKEGGYVTKGGTPNTKRGEKGASGCHCKPENKLNTSPLVLQLRIVTESDLHSLDTAEVDRLESPACSYRRNG